MNRLRPSCFLSPVGFALCCACGQAEIPQLLTSHGFAATEIINGRPTRPGDYSEVGAVLVRWTDWDGEREQVFCTGTLIAPDVVLTAAHCKIDKEVGVPVRYYFSRALDIGDAGDVLSEMPAPTVRIKKIIVHPYFNTPRRFGLSRANDVSVAILAYPIFDSKPARLLAASAAQVIKPGSSTDIVGYGMRTAPEYGGGDDLGVKAAAVSVVNQVGRYELQVGRWWPTPQKCVGDSGGPSYMKTSAGYRLVSITSRRYDSNGCTRGGVDTRVDPYLNWIAATMAAACKDGTRVVCYDLE